MSKDEYDLMKEETVDQIKEFTETLDRMNKGDVSLNNKFSQMKKVLNFKYFDVSTIYKYYFFKAIRTAIATAFNTTETIKMFGDQNVTELEMQLLALDQEFRLKKITIEQYEFKKVDLLTKLQNIGYCLAEQDKLFFEKRQDRLYQQMEQIVDDEPEQ